MRDHVYTGPTDAELRAIHARAQRMRAEATRSLLIAAWSRIRGLFAKSGAHAAGAH